MAVLYLIGFMGTGKTSVGREIAAMLGREFVDLDSQIEARQKKSIKEIFEQDGEDSFRRIESELLRETSRRDNCIVACGGGIVTRRDNTYLIRKTGKVVCLTASEEAIRLRTAGSDIRPLLNVGDPGDAITELMKKREAQYRSVADITVDTMGKTPEEVAQEVCKAIGVKP